MYICINEVSSMKRFYQPPEAQLVCFRAKESLAYDNEYQRRGTEDGHAQEVAMLAGQFPPEAKEA
jgi:hypothetical protein